MSIKVFESGAHLIVDGMEHAIRRGAVRARACLAKGTAELTVDGPVDVTARERASVNVMDGARVHLYDEASCVAYDSEVHALGDSKVAARGHTIVYAHDACEVDARDDVLVLLCVSAAAKERLPRITLRDGAHVMHRFAPRRRCGHVDIVDAAAMARQQQRGIGCRAGCIDPEFALAHKAIELRGEGLKRADIAQQLGLTPQRVSYLSRLLPQPSRKSA